jgi:hypothetical protein
MVSRPLRRSCDPFLCCAFSDLVVRIILARFLFKMVSLRQWRITLLDARDELAAKPLDLPYKIFRAFGLCGREEPSLLLASTCSDPNATVASEGTTGRIDFMNPITTRYSGLSSENLTMSE